MSVLTGQRQVSKYAKHSTELYRVLMCNQEAKPVSRAAGAM
jgi:hypothetical protein